MCIYRTDTSEMNTSSSNMACFFLVSKSQLASSNSTSNSNDAPIQKRTAVGAVSSLQHSRKSQIRMQPACCNETECTCGIYCYVLCQLLKRRNLLAC
jgi:hypothetical protein